MHCIHALIAKKSVMPAIIGEGHKMLDVKLVSVEPVKDAAPTPYSLAEVK